MCRLYWNMEASTSWKPQGLPRPVMGLIYLIPYHIIYKYELKSQIYYGVCTIPDLFYRYLGVVTCLLYSTSVLFWKDYPQLTVPLNNFREKGLSISGYFPFFNLLNIQSMPLSSKCDFCIKLTKPKSVYARISTYSLKPNGRLGGQ